ncbi:MULTISPECIES: MerR family transcriptional regulator [unclassified Streptomyces]|uniref:MerR family transcriptional regulator n=1 Tax=unclassified Streptomyces TaxID=2593676 RepID=UPI002E18CCFF|nr:MULTISPECIES: MerR family transcriptional regulator [unclassified Streptomyces]
MLIGEVARRSGVSARMLRHYESLGLVRPSERTGSGYREYSGDDIRRIFHIESLRSLGLSLREIGRALDEPGFTPSSLVGDLIRQTRERIAAETELLTRLNRIDAAEPGDWEEVLQVVALLQALSSKSADARQRAALSSGGQDALPVAALVEAVLSETDTNVAGALRWALVRSGGAASLPLLVEALGSPEAAVRERAAQCLAELPGDEATTELRQALAGPDAVVRGRAAVALGNRGAADAVPELIDMIVAGRNDTDAADALSVLSVAPASAGATGSAVNPAPGASAPAGDTASAVDPASGATAPSVVTTSAEATAPAERIATALVERLARPATEAPARGRLTQALAGIPGATATRALVELSADEDRAVALTATYLLRLRDGER